MVHSDFMSVHHGGGPMSSLEESRQLIDDLLGQIGVDEEKSAHIRQAADLSLEAIEAARRATATSPMPEGTDLVGFGSLARFELTPKSDLDYLFIGQGCEPAVDLQLVDDVLSSLIEGMTVSRPGSSGIFGGSVDIDELVEVIGLDRDSNTSTTRRVLFLEESVSLARPEVHDRALQALLGRYLAANRGSRRIPRFLINDVIRYWRTIAVDYQAKSEGDEPKALRYLKLLIPRKLCYVAAIEPLFELNAVELIDEDERLDFLVSKYRQPSIVRLLQLMDVLVTRDPDSRKNVERVVGVLDDYTGKTSDPRWRRRVELDGHSPDRKSSDSYGQMRQQGKELHSILGALLSGPVMGKFSREYMLL